MCILCAAAVFAWRQHRRRKLTNTDVQMREVRHLGDAQDSRACDTQEIEVHTVHANHAYEEDTTMRVGPDSKGAVETTEYHTAAASSSLAAGMQTVL